MIGKYSKNKRETLDYILVYLLISVSGNYAFGKIAIILTFLVSFIVFISRKKSLDRIFLFIITLLTIILLLQMIKFDFYPWVTTISLYIIVLTAYFIVKSVGTEFIKIFVNIMTIISLISLIFFVLMNMIPGFIHYMKPFAFVVDEHMVGGDWKMQIAYYTGIYTFKYMPYDTHFWFTRNNGPFWETGAFGGYLMIAFIFNTIRTGQLFNKKSIILLITIFTTVATTTYVALMAFIFFYVLVQNKYRVLKAPILLLISIIGIFLFTYLDFIGAKIENRIELAENPNLIYSAGGSRFGDAVRDLHAFTDHEIIGRGMNKETRLSEIDRQSGYTMRTNGMTDQLVRFGSIFFIFMFLILYLSFYTVNNYYHNLNSLVAVYLIFVIILILQSEVYFGFSLFWSLLFLYSAYMKSEKEDSALYRNTRIQ